MHTCSDLLAAPSIEYAGLNLADNMKVHNALSLQILHTQVSICRKDVPQILSYYPKDPTLLGNFKVYVHNVRNKGSFYGDELKKNVIDQSRTYVARGDIR